MRSTLLGLDDSRHRVGHLGVPELRAPARGQRQTATTTDEAGRVLIQVLLPPSCVEEDGDQREIARLVNVQTAPGLQAWPQSREARLQRVDQVETRLITASGQTVITRTRLR